MPQNPPSRPRLRRVIHMGYASSRQQVLTQRGRRSATSGAASLAEEDGATAHSDLN